MKWFVGSIADAISFAQRQKIVFVAFVEGSCNKSKTMASAFDDQDVVNELEKSTFVCIRLEGPSIGYKQLVECYRNVPVPSLFFISHYGQPLDIVDGNIFNDYADVKKAVMEAAEYSVNMNVVQQPPKPGDKLLDERRQQVDEILDTKRRKFENSSTKSGKVANDGASGSGITINASPEVAKKPLEGSELKKLADERKEEAMARQKILDQIAQDKAERAAKMKEITDTKPSAPVEEKQAFLPSSEARIQFKLPTGVSKSNMFPKVTKLIEIRRYIDSNLELPYRDYKLTTTFPRREFTAEDSESTLEDLNLVPTAVLLILPKSSGMLNPISGNFLGVVSDMVQSFLQPVYSLANYVHGLLFGRWGGEGGAPGTQPAPTTNQRQTTQTRTTVRKSGNIHSLRDLKDGNDENNTWNGNSTQQM